MALYLGGNTKAKPEMRHGAVRTSERAVAASIAGVLSMPAQAELEVDRLVESGHRRRAFEQGGAIGA